MNQQQTVLGKILEWSQERQEWQKDAPLQTTQAGASLVPHICYVLMLTSFFQSDDLFAHFILKIIENTGLIVLKNRIFSIL